MILDEYRRYVAERFGFRTWTRVLAAADRPSTQQYGLGDVYPDEELGLLAVRTAEVTKTPPAEVLRGFGESLVPEMLRIYSYLLDPKWDFSAFLLNMEPMLHAALKLHTPGAQPIKVQARRLGVDSVEVFYDSPLHAYAAIEGVIRGAAAEFGVTAEVSQPECALRGYQRCRFEVGVKARSDSRRSSPA